MPLAQYTHLTLVVDRSGSMSSVAPEMTEGIRTLVQEQLLEPGLVSFTLVQFDSEHETVHRLTNQPFDYQLQPRGNTALLDAVGTEIECTGRDLAGLPEESRPEKVLFVVVTDGYENSSRHFNLERVRQLIQQQTTVYNWQFQFIGAEAAAWQGEELGMKQTRYSGSKRGTERMMSLMNENIKSFRSKPGTKVEFDLEPVIEDESE